MPKKNRLLPTVKCLGCGAVLTSKSRHDFQQCKCENETFVDGGGEQYVRYGGKDREKVQLLRGSDPLLPHVRRRMPVWDILVKNKHKMESIGVIPRCHNCMCALHIENFRGAGQTAMLFGVKHRLSRWECPRCGDFIIATPYPRV